MGLGMALPYLAIGLFPRLIGLLPRPGNWMVTFKHAMGYAMLGAGIFLFGSLKEKFAIPTLSMALAIAIACSIVGHTSIGAELGQKLKAWAYGAIVLALGCWIAFYVLIPAHELDWQMFSKVALKEELEKGNIVFVDFTADW
jgi:thiol:disulfide interchange protein DsbD